jgi:hypothetical protein
MLCEACSAAKMIVCTLPRGMATDVMKALYERVELINIQHDTGRGIYSNHDIEHPVWQEVDMLSIIVSPEHADHVFLTLYELTQIQMNHDRYIYQVHLPVVTHFELPQLTALHH